MANRMAHLALYQKYRPAHFADLIGQGPITAVLTAALATGKVAHAYLFTGSRGTGKTSSARLLAKGINCTDLTDGEPCGKCANCQAIVAGTMMDVLEVDAASNRGIDEIRDLRDKVGFTPSQGTRKAYIIDEVHMLTKEAFNALLKTLEEPPAHAMFILATTEPHKVPQTIISRCQRFDFRPATVAVLTDHLQKITKAEKLQAEPAALETVAMAARGSFRDALSLLDVVAAGTGSSITAEHVQATLGLADAAIVGTFERALAAGDRDAAIGALRHAAEQGIDPGALRISILSYLRSLLQARSGGASSAEIARLAADWDLAALVRALRAYLDMPDYAVSAHPDLPLEVTTMELLLADQPSSGGRHRASASPATKPAVPSPQASSPSPETTPASRTPAETTPAPEPLARQSSKEATQDEARPAPSDAVGLWEELLRRTKAEYSLSVCLQKTRPLELTDGYFALAVQSDLFLKKLAEDGPNRAVEAACREILGRPVTLKLTRDDLPPRDVFEDALAVFEGAQVE